MNPHQYRSTEALPCICRYVLHWHVTATRVITPVCPITNLVIAIGWSGPCPGASKICDLRAEQGALSQDLIAGIYICHFHYIAFVWTPLTFISVNITSMHTTVSWKLKLQAWCVTLSCHKLCWVYCCTQTANCHWLAKCLWASAIFLFWTAARLESASQPYM